MDFSRSELLSRRRFLVSAGALGAAAWLGPPGLRFHREPGIVEEIRHAAAVDPMQVQRLRGNLSAIIGSGGNIVAWQPSKDKADPLADIVAPKPISTFDAEWGGSIISRTSSPAWSTKACDHYDSSRFDEHHSNRATGHPFADGKPSGKSEVFADGFAGANKNPRVAYTGAATVVRRPSTSAQRTPAPGGGEAAPAQPTESAGPPEGTHPEAGAQPGGTPAAGISPAMFAQGDSIYSGQLAGATCAGCHGTNAKGTPLAPDLTDAFVHLSRCLPRNATMTAMTSCVDHAYPAFASPANDMSPWPAPVST